MRFLSRPTAAVLCCCLWIVSAHAAEKGAAYQAALESITAEALGQHVGRLADSAMEGREAGTRGGLAAANYLAEQFARFHLRGAGADGGFFQPFAPNFRNVLAMIAGNDPELRDQVILVGAHYDHVGYGGRGLSLGPYGFIHPGADDNASGTSAVLQLAEACTLLSEPPKRSILFAAWDAEEKGLLGTKHWTAHPTVSLSQVVAALNVDMIGRLRDDHVTVYGSRTGYGWRRLLSYQNDGPGLNLDFCWMLKPLADHHPIFEHQIPVLMAHTGLHQDYHRPSDSAQRINQSGMMRVTRLLFGLIYELAESSVAAPGFRAAARHESPDTERATLAQVAKPADRLGVGWIEEATPANGVRVSMIVPKSPAERAGLRAGDCILQFAGRPIHSDDDFFAAVSSAESLASLIARRTGEDAPLGMTVELNGAPLRWGIAWRVDDAEPGTIILTHVVPGSPAAVAGLQAGDRVYQVGGRDFADERAFAELAKMFSESIPLLVERDGRLRPVVLQLQRTEPIKRAA